MASIGTSISKGQLKKVPCCLMSKNGELVSANKEKAEVLSVFFASVFAGNLSSQPTQVDGSQDEDQEDKVSPTVSEEKVWTT